jgi:hypothetical protein
MSALGKVLPGWARAVFSGMLLAMAVEPLCAHTLPISYLHLVADTNYLHLELTFNPFELSFFSELDSNHNGRLEPSELEGKQDQVTPRILDCLKIYIDGKLVRAEVAGLMPDLDSHHVTLRAHYLIKGPMAKITLESSLTSITSGSHLTQVTFLHDGQRQLAQLDLQSPTVTFVLAPKLAQKQHSSSQQRLKSPKAL